MYVDESGDCGLVNAPTAHFALSGIVVHEIRWQQCLDQLIAFRRRMKVTYGLKMREELHARQMLIHPGPIRRIAKHDRLAIIRSFAVELAKMSYLSIVNVIVDKTTKTQNCDVFSLAWTALFQRFENGIANRNLHGPQNPDERGILFPDATDSTKLTALLRRIRRINYVPGKQGLPPRNIPIKLVIEDPNFRDSSESYFMQAADLAAFLLYQQTRPCRYVHKKGARNYISRLTPVLYTQASSSDVLGVVRL